MPRHTHRTVEELLAGEVQPRRRRPWRRVLFIYAIYILVILAGAYTIYRLLPAETLDAITKTYVTPDRVLED